MRIQSIGIVLVYCGAMASVTLVGEPVSAALPCGEPQVDTRKVIDVRSRTTPMQLKTGRNAVYTTRTAGRSRQWSRGRA